MASAPLGVHVSQGARSGSMVASKARRDGVPGLRVSVAVSRLLLLGVVPYTGQRNGRQLTLLGEERHENHSFFGVQFTLFDVV